MKRLAVIGVVLVVAIGVLVGANWPGAPLEEGAIADRAELIKGSRVLRLYSGDALLKEYSVALGGEPIGHKQREGDERTPEGNYTLDYRNPTSGFYRSIHVSYPSPSDQKRAAQAGVDPGGMIMIHGLPNHLGWIGRFHRVLNWTDGCIAVSNAEMDEIWKAVPNGTPIEIQP